MGFHMASYGCLDHRYPHDLQWHQGLWKSLWPPVAARIMDIHMPLSQMSDINMVNMVSCGSPDHGPPRGVQTMLSQACLTSRDHVDVSGLCCCQRPCWYLWSMQQPDGMLIISAPCHHQCAGPCWHLWATLDKWHFNVINHWKDLQEKDTIFEKVPRWDYLIFSLEVATNSKKKYGAVVQEEYVSVFHVQMHGNSQNWSFIQGKKGL